MWRLIAGLVLGLILAAPFAVVTVTLGLQARNPVVELQELGELSGKGLASKRFVRVLLRADRVHLAGWYPEQSAAVIQANGANAYAQLRKPDYERLVGEGQFAVLGYVTEAAVGTPGVTVAGPEVVHWPSGLTTWREVELTGAFALATAIGAGILINGWRVRRRGV